MFKDPCKRCGADPTDYTCYLEDVSTFAVVIGAINVVMAFIELVLVVGVQMCCRKTNDGKFLKHWGAALVSWDQLVNYYMDRFPIVVACQNDLQGCMRNNLPQFTTAINTFKAFVQMSQYLYYKRKEVIAMGEKADQLEKNAKKTPRAILKSNLRYFIVFSVYFAVTLSALIPTGLYVSNCNATYSAFVVIFAVIACLSVLMQFGPQIVEAHASKQTEPPSVLNIFFNTFDFVKDVLNIIYLAIIKSDTTTIVSKAIEIAAEVIYGIDMIVLLLWYFACRKKPTGAEEMKVINVRDTHVEYT